MNRSFSEEYVGNVHILISFKLLLEISQVGIDTVY